MPVSGSKYTEYTSTSDSSSTNTSDKKFGNVSKKKNTIDVDKVREQFQDSDWNDDQTRYRIASQIASENLSDRDNVTKEEYRDEIDNVYSQLGSKNTGASVRGGNPFFDAVGGLKNLINGAQHGIASGVDWLYDNTIGGLTGTQDLFNADDVEGVVDILGDVALTAAGPAGWALAFGKNAIQNSDALYEGITGKDAITGLDIDEGARAAGLAQGVGGTMLAALPGAGKASAKLGAKAINNAAKAAKGTAEGTAKTAAKEVTEDAAEEAVKNTGIKDTIDRIKEAGDTAAKKVESRRPLDTDKPSTYMDIMNHVKDVSSSRNAAMKQEVKNVVRDGLGINLPKSIKEVPGSLKNVGTNIAEGAKKTADNIKTLPTTIENMPEKIELPSRMQAQLQALNPVNKDVRVAARKYLDETAPRDIQDAMMKTRGAVLKDIVESAGEKTTKQKVGGVLKKGAKGIAGQIIGPGAASALPLAYLDTLDDTQSNYGSAVVPAYLGAILSRGKRANIGPTGKLGSAIPQLTRSANASMRSRRRDQDEVDLEGGKYSEENILNALKVRR